MSVIDTQYAAKLRTQDLSVSYHNRPAIHQTTLSIGPRGVLALIGPSGCGKSTFLRSLNRMNDTLDGVRVQGHVFLDEQDIYASSVDPVRVRQRIGMVFQRSNPFPKSIFENVAYGLRVAGIRDKHRLNEKVEHALRQAVLWDEVKDRLHASGLSMSGGQQQRLCIARALAVEPEVLLMDEPTSALDPIATAKLEDLMIELRHTLTLVIVTHNLQQAARISQQTAFFYLGRLVEIGNTADIFRNPVCSATEDFITGRFG